MFCSPNEESHTLGPSGEKRAKMLLGQQTLGRLYHRQPFPSLSHGPDVCSPQATTTALIWLARINSKISFPQLHVHRAPRCHMAHGNHPGQVRKQHFFFFFF